MCSFLIAFFPNVPLFVKSRVTAGMLFQCLVSYFVVVVVVISVVVVTFVYSSSLISGNKQQCKKYNKCVPKRRIQTYSLQNGSCQYLEEEDVCK